MLDLILQFFGQYYRNQEEMSRNGPTPPTSGLEGAGVNLGEIICQSSSFTFPHWHFQTNAQIYRRQPTATQAETLGSSLTLKEGLVQRGERWKPTTFKPTKCSRASAGRLTCTYDTTHPHDENDLHNWSQGGLAQCCLKNIHIWSVRFVARLPWTEPIQT